MSLATLARPRLPMLALVPAVVISGLVALSLRMAPGPAQEPALTSRVSTDAIGVQANGESTGPSPSSDARYVAFVSWATNLVPGDTNAAADVFVKDRVGGSIVRASVATGGAQAEGESVAPSISGDGRYVAFVSDAANLVPGDANDTRDVFIRDTQAGSTTAASIGLGGETGSGGSFAPSVSADGRYVAFVSHAKNLVAGDANGQRDVFVRDLQTGALERVSVGPGGIEAIGASEGPSISADGRFVAFASTAGNLVPAGPGGDTNRVWDVFVRDRTSSTTVRASVGIANAEGNGHSWTPSISADGRYVAFASHASNLAAGDVDPTPDVFVRDLAAGATERVSIGLGGGAADGASSHPSICADGRLVAFYSEAANLVANDSNACQDVFLRDMAAGSTIRISVGTLGSGGNGPGLWPSISADGRYVAFPDAASNLAAGDTNAALDVFVRGPLL